MRVAASLYTLVGFSALARAAVIPDGGVATEVIPKNSTVLLGPEGTPDGVYSIYLDDSTGDSVVDKLSDLIEGADLSQNLKPRNQYRCQSITLASNNIERAAYNLGQTCGKSGARPSILV